MKANFAFFTVAIDVVDIFGHTIDFLGMKIKIKPLYFLINFYAHDFLLFLQS
jgi:hypothetical protein